MPESHELDLNPLEKRFDRHAASRQVLPRSLKLAAMFSTFESSASTAT
jgi:hypothetical protein